MVQTLWHDHAGDVFDIVPVYRSDQGSKDGVCWAPGDNPEVLPTVDGILALWGITSGDPRMLGLNAKLATEAMALGTVLGVSRVIHCSSAAVYPASQTPLLEEQELHPPSPYGQSKLAMEQAVVGWQPGQGPEPVCLRIGNVAGADSLFGNLRPGGQAVLDRFDDGHGPERSYLAPDDLVRVLVAVMSAAKVPPVLNAAAPVPTPMEHIARAIGCDVCWKDAPETALRRVWLDTTRLQKICLMTETAAAAEHLVASARRSGVWP